MTLVKKHLTAKSEASLDEAEYFLFLLNLLIEDSKAVLERCSIPDNFKSVALFCIYYFKLS